MPKRPIFSLLLTLALAFSSCSGMKEISSAPALPADSPPITLQGAQSTERQAVFVSVLNDVSARASDSADFLPASIGQSLATGGEARSGQESKARLDLLPEGTIIRLGPNSILSISEISPDPSAEKTTKLQLLFGQLWIVLNGGSLEVETDLGTASVRGSYLSVSFDPTQTGLTVTCLEGSCALSNSYGTVALTDGQASAVLAPDKAPKPARPLSETEIKEWLENNPESLHIISPEQSSPQDKTATQVNTRPLKYSLTNNCKEGNAWAWTFERLPDENGGALSEVITTAPSATSSGSLPPGQYLVSNTAPEGQTNQKQINSDAGAIAATACPQGSGQPQPVPGITRVTTYRLTNNCPEDEGTWHWIFSGATTITVDIPRGQTVSGALPAGDFSARDYFDSGKSHTTSLVPGGGILTVTSCPGN